LGFLYVLGAIAIYVIDKRKNLINRILRVSNYPNLMNEENKRDNVINKIGVWINYNNLNLEVKEFLILIFILFSISDWIIF